MPKTTPKMFKKANQRSVCLNKDDNFANRKLKIFDYLPCLCKIPIRTYFLIHFFFFFFNLGTDFQNFWYHNICMMVFHSVMIL